MLFALGFVPSNTFNGSEKWLFVLKCNPSTGEITTKMVLPGSTLASARDLDSVLVERSNGGPMSRFLCSSDMNWNHMKSQFLQISSKYLVSFELTAGSGILRGHNWVQHLRWPQELWFQINDFLNHRPVWTHSPIWQAVKIARIYVQTSKHLRFEIPFGTTLWESNLESDLP